MAGKNCAMLAMDPCTKRKVGASGRAAGSSSNLTDRPSESSTTLLLSYSEEPRRQVRAEEESKLVMCPSSGVFKIMGGS